VKINNAIISFFWNNFDFLIRFGYCKLGPVSKLMNKLLFWKLYSSDFEKLDSIFEDSRLLLKKNNISPKNKTILEIGPGNSYLMAYNFLMQGAKKVILVDRFPRTGRTKRQRETFRKEIDYIAQKYGRTPFFIIEGKIDKKYVEFINQDLSEINIKNVDLIFTNSVLEHLKLIEENIHSMSKSLNDNGYMLHHLDLRDHYNFNNPFLFYKYEDSVWNKCLTKEGISYTNRLRYDDFRELFRKYGFEIVQEKVKRQRLTQKTLSSKFHKKSKEALEITNLSILLRKAG